MKLGGGGTTIEVAPFGAMLASARFDLGDGFVAEPFFMNPWSNDKREIEPFLRNLGAEWACVPFGRAGAASDLPDKWHINQDIKDWNHFIHGYGSNNVWSLEQIDAGSLVARIDYPEDTPIKSLERTIAIDPYGALNFSLIIEARWDARVGIGLHPVFDLTDAAPGSCALTVKGRDTAWSFPIDVEPGRGAFAPDQRNVPLSKMDGVSGGLVDGTQLPLDGRTEDLVLLTDPGGEISLTRKDRVFERRTRIPALGRARPGHRDRADRCGI